MAGARLDWAMHESGKQSPCPFYSIIIYQSWSHMAPSTLNKHTIIHCRHPPYSHCHQWPHHVSSSNAFPDYPSSRTSLPPSYTPHTDMGTPLRQRRPYVRHVDVGLDPSGDHTCSRIPRSCMLWGVYGISYVCCLQVSFSYQVEVEMRKEVDYFMSLARENALLQW